MPSLVEIGPVVLEKNILKFCCVFSLFPNYLPLSYLEIGPWFWSRRFFNFINVFSLFRNYLPLEKCRALHLNKTESPSPKDALCQIFIKIGPVVLEEKWFF